MTLAELRAARAAKTREIRNFLEQNSGALDAAQQTELDGLYAEVEAYQPRIENHERLLDMEANNMNDPEAAARAARALAEVNASNPDTPGAPGSAQGGSPQDEVRAQVFEAFLRGGDRAVNQLPETVLAEYGRIQNDLSTGTEADGGALVPTTFSSTLLQSMKAFGGMRGVGTVRSTLAGENIQWPTVDDTDEEGEWVAESTAVSEDGDPNFGTVMIGAHLISSKAVAVPWALMQDAVVGEIGAMLDPMLSMRLARGTNRAYTTGDGVGKPLGIDVSASVGHTTAAGMTGQFAVSDFLDLEHSVDIGYRSDSSWMLSDTALKMIKKMKDAEGRPLWVPGVSSSAPAEIWGYGYTVNTHMADPAAGVKSVLFGKLSNYLIRDVTDIRLFRFTDSVYTKKGQVGFLAMMRTDGRLIAADDQSIKALRQAAV